MTFALALSVGAGCLLPSSPAPAQCQSWNPFLSDAGVNGVNGLRMHTLSVYNGDLVAGGFFSSAGGQSVNNIARWDGVAWHPLAGGLNSTARAMTEYIGELIVGGDFTTANLGAAVGIARWNGSNWLPMGEMNNVRSLFVFEGELFAGGQYFTVNGEEIWSIARLNGGAVWQDVGGSVTLSGGPVPYVAAMVEFGGDLIAGGHFIDMGNVPVHNIARWDGDAWHAMGEGITGPSVVSPVNALAVYNGKVFAGGEFTTVDGQAIANIAQWDGSSWAPVGGGVNGPVFALTVHNGELIVGGEFNSAGGLPASNIARWDDVSETWQSLDVGVNSDVFALTVYGFDVIAGGQFVTAGGDEALLIARYAGDGPEITQQPQNVLVAEGQDANMSVLVGNLNDGPFSYQWRRDGIELIDGRFIGGATEPMLTIASATGADFGVYDVQVTSACGSVLSAPAALGITAAPGGSCLADIVSSDTFQPPPDGIVDGADLAYLLGAWGACK